MTAKSKENAPLKELDHTKVKLFTNGGSQAVRIPKAMRFESEEVTFRKVGRSIIIDPVDSDEWAWLLDFEPLDPSFIIPDDDIIEQERPGLDVLFQ